MPRQCDNTVSYPNFGVLDKLMEMSESERNEIYKNNLDGSDWQAVSELCKTGLLPVLPIASPSLLICSEIRFVRLWRYLTGFDQNSLVNERTEMQFKKLILPFPLVIQRKSFSLTAPHLVSSPLPTRLLRAGRRLG